MEFLEIGLSKIRERKSTDCIVRQWCYFHDTVQEHDDVCIISNIPSSMPESNSSNEYVFYGWYKITNIAHPKKPCVYRRLRRRQPKEGYPNDCLVVDPGTAAELNLKKTDRKDGSNNKFRIHPRNIKHNLAPLQADSSGDVRIEEHVRKCGGKIFYSITGIPIYQNAQIELKRVKGIGLSSFIGRTARHPDYSMRVTFYLAILSTFLGIVSIVLSVSSCRAASTHITNYINAPLV